MIRKPRKGHEFFRAKLGINYSWQTIDVATDPINGDWRLAKKFDRFTEHGTVRVEVGFEQYEEYKFWRFPTAPWISFSHEKPRHNEWCECYHADGTLSQGQWDNLLFGGMFLLNGNVGNECGPVVYWQHSL